MEVRRLASLEGLIIQGWGGGGQEGKKLPGQGQK